MSYTTRTPESSLFIFLRHGESIGNAEERHQGQADYPLTDRGKREVQLLCESWEKKSISLDHAISSPLLRAKQTAEIIAPCLNLEIDFDPLWMERDNGKLAGLLHKDAKKKHPPPDFIPLHQPIAETGETQWELFLRAGNALNQIMKLSPGDYLIVSHGGFLNMVLHAVFGIIPSPNFQGPNFRFSNTGYSTLLYKPENENWILLGHNNTNHLDHED